MAGDVQALAWQNNFLLIIIYFVQLIWFVYDMDIYYLCSFISDIR
jgi:hypothetical protein